MALSICLILLVYLIRIMVLNITNTFQFSPCPDAEDNKNYIEITASNKNDIRNDLKPWRSI